MNMQAAVKTTKTVKPSKPRKTAKAANGKASQSKKEPPKAGTAAAQLLALTIRKSGVTHKEACAHLGWKSCRPYLFKVCAAYGVRLRKERMTETNEVRYFGSKPTQRT